MSERKDIAYRIAEKIIDWKLTNPFGGDVTQSSDRKGKPYRIAFSYPRLLDGMVSVYGPRFIQVQTMGPLGRDRGGVFTSETDALEFIRLAFVALDEEAADAIPRKAS